MSADKDRTISEKWETVIGLEIHAQLKTETKLFSPDSAAFSAGENNHIHPVSLGFPGVLPVLNRRAALFALRVARAFECRIQKQSLFARKSYFYPDLPKGYQISQYDRPFCEGGYVRYHFNGSVREVRLERIHIEEDAGRSLHRGSVTLVNFNRAGVSLLEMVTLPDLRDPAEAAGCVRAVRRTLRYLDVCDGNLEEGSLRCDCNISLRRPGEETLGTKVELKNLNSFRFIEKALQYERKRQARLLEEGESVARETRLYDSVKNRTFSMRSKEVASDYRYFPDPDLLPLNSEELLEREDPLPELPFQKFEKYKKIPGLSVRQIETLIEDKAFSEYFEEVAQGGEDPRAACHWLTGELQARLKETGQTVKNIPVSAENLSKLIKLVSGGVISIKTAKEVFGLMWETGRPPDPIIEEEGFKQISDEKTLRELVQKILQAHPKQLKDYREGRTKLFGFFTGQAMKAVKGQAHPQKLSEILKEELGK